MLAFAADLYIATRAREEENRRVIERKETYAEWAWAYVHVCEMLAHVECPPGVKQ